METSVRISTEPQVQLIPSFPTHKAPSFEQKRSKTFFNLKQPKASSEGHIVIQKDVSQYCKCPHVLVADDDPFQEFYYNILFEKLGNFGHLCVSKENFRYTIFRSGEELLERYKKTNKCECGSQFLIVVDYDMGLDKLSGVETATKLRQIGHKGPIILRTSENQEDLFEKNPALGSDAQIKIIDCLLDKSNHMKTSQAIRLLLKR